jgi:sulfatase modifying factor 1
MADGTSKTGCCSVARDAGTPPLPEVTPATSQKAVSGHPVDAVLLEGGSSTIGTDKPILPVDGEGPRRIVKLKPFLIDRHAVSGERFRQFVEDTGYVTEAERFGWSFVFHMLLPDAGRYQAPIEARWWRKVEGACWSRPEGPGSNLEGREDHPVLHIGWADANAFCRWSGGRLPTEAEWEYAARGGLPDATYPWGNEEPDDLSIFCNIWQGRFPDENTELDGYVGTAPVSCYAPNGYGLYNMIGNVWEWCSDPFRIHSLAKSARLRNAEFSRQGMRVMKGGSYLCHASYCSRYRIAARSGRPADTSAGNTGFRVAYDRRPEV